VEKSIYDQKERAAGTKTKILAMNQSLKRWRLVLGGDEADGTGADLNDAEKQIDQALGALYEFEHSKRFQYGKTPASGAAKQGGHGASQPNIARWLGDIRKYFPQSVVQVMQNDAMRHETLRQRMLFEPEILEQVTPDVHLVATLMALGKLLPSKTKDTARIVVRKVVDELMQRLEHRMIQAITGALNRTVRNHRPRLHEIDWNTTIRRNLRHYQVAYKTIIPESLIGFGRKNRRALQDIILCIDQSGSMGTSVVYSSIFGAVMASLPAVTTRMIAFDTEVADLTDALEDPVELLFGVQLGGGTDINKALRYCAQWVSRPEETILILISDLYEGGDQAAMRTQVAELTASGVHILVLLALNDEGAPSYDSGNAQFFAALGIPVFACTPDLFPDLMAAAIARQDLFQWAGAQNVVLQGGIQRN
jgi:Mg-chelatase subunit ChlD